MHGNDIPMRLADVFGRGSHVRRVDRVLDPSEADRLVLQHLRRLGCDPARPRGSRHFLYLPERIDAEAVALALADDGWQTSVEECEDDSTWLVVASRVRGLSEQLVRETRTRFDSLAAEHGGEYDGWEAETGSSP